MTPQDVLSDLAESRTAPLAAIQAALANKEEMLPVFLREIERSFELPDKQLPFGGAYGIMFEIFGQWADQRSYLPLVRFLRLDENTLENLLGDCLTELGDRVMAAVAADDLTPLRDAILDTKAYVFARSQMMSALIQIGLTQPARRAEVVALFEDIIVQLEPNADVVVVAEWAMAVAMLGISRFEAKARAAIAAIPRQMSPLTLEEFDKITEQRASDPEANWSLRRYLHPAPIDTIKDVSGWYCYSKEYIQSMEAEKARAADPLGFLDTPDPAVNIYRHVSRNDPCPCGSGKKFKKCCLS
jgi:uncharacterized protein